MASSRHQPVLRPSATRSFAPDDDRVAELCRFAFRFDVLAVAVQSNPQSGGEGFHVKVALWKRDLKALFAKGLVDSGV